MIIALQKFRTKPHSLLRQTARLSVEKFVTKTYKRRSLVWINGRRNWTNQIRDLSFFVSGLFLEMLIRTLHKKENFQTNKQLNTQTIYWHVVSTLVYTAKPQCNVGNVCVYFFFWKNLCLAKRLVPADILFMISMNTFSSLLKKYGLKVWLKNVQKVIILRVIFPCCVRHTYGWSCQQ